MKRLLCALIVPLILVGALAAHPSIQDPIARCPTPPIGPPAASLTAYGSFYSETPQTLVDPYDPVNFTTTQSVLNIDNSIPTQFTILQSGYYYIHFGVSNSGEDSDNSAVLLEVGPNLGSLLDVPGSVLSVPVSDQLSSMALIIPISAGQIIRLSHLDSGTLVTGLGGASGVMAFINFMRIAPL